MVAIGRFCVPSASIAICSRWSYSKRSPRQDPAQTSPSRKFTIVRPRSKTSTPDSRQCYYLRSMHFHWLDFVSTRRSPNHRPVLIVKFNARLVMIHPEPCTDVPAVVLQNEFLRLYPPHRLLSLCVSAEKDQACQKH